MDRLALFASPALAFSLVLGAGGTAAVAQPMLRIENAAARVVVIPEDRRDVVYVVAQGRNRLPPLVARRDGAAVVLDGGLAGGFHPFGGLLGPTCQGSGDRIRVTVPGRGATALADLPVVTARVPLEARVDVGQAVYGEIGPSRSLEFVNAGCGDWRVGDVRGSLRIESSGSGDVKAGSASDALVRIAGSSDVRLSAVGGLDARITGSGDVKAAAVNGPLLVRLVGSGDVAVDGGRADSISALVSGSGNLRFRGVARSLSATVTGSGDVNVARVEGTVSKHVTGSGDVNVGR